MKNDYKLFLVFYILGMMFLYIPRLIFPNIELIEGVMGMRTGLFYNYGYYFLFFIAVAQVFFLKLLRSLPGKKLLFALPVYSILAYLLFIFLSVLFVSVYFEVKSAHFDPKEAFVHFERLFTGALVYGLFVILASPITYLIIFNQWLVSRFFIKICKYKI